MKPFSSLRPFSIYALCTALCLAGSSFSHLAAQSDTLSTPAPKGPITPMPATASNPDVLMVPTWMQVVDTAKTRQVTWDLQFGMAFPMQDFHDSDPENPLAGYAKQGYTLGASMMLGFGGKGNTGVHLGIAYTGMRLHPTFRDSVFAAADRVNQVAESIFLPDEDYKPRYDIIQFNTGWAYEGSSESVAAYARVTVGMNLTRISGTTFERTTFLPVETTNRLTETSNRLTISTGHSIEFGLRFQKQLSLGLAWHYLGEPDIDYGVHRRPSEFPEDAFDHLATQRRIHLLEVKLGYGFDYRGKQKRY